MTLSNRRTALLTRAPIFVFAAAASTYAGAAPGSTTPGPTTPGPAVTINWVGGSSSTGSNITGKIVLQNTADVINVTGGTVNFFGIVNPNCLPSAGVPAGSAGGAADSPTLSSCGLGTLNISSGSKLHMAINATEGPSYVFMNTLNMTAPTGGTAGTITFDLPPATGGEAAVGTYPQVFVNTANLGGTLVANIVAPNGLFETTTYENIIDANVRNGVLDRCVLNGIPANSLLLNFGCVYDSQHNVDLVLTRKPFDQVSGLNTNGIAIGTGLNSVYNTNLTGGAANMFADLFLSTNGSSYNVALNELSGSVYANYLNSFPSVGVHLNDLLERATTCEIPVLAGSVLECRPPSPIHLWGQLDYQWRNAHGDAEAGATKSERFTGLLGVDTNFGPQAIVGVDAGYVTNDLHDKQFGDHVNGDGWTAGVYGVYDPGAFFLKGLTTYSSYNSHATRHINFVPLATGASFQATPTGSPDVRMWTAGLHGGARFPLSATSIVTPYFDYDHVSAKIRDTFTEDNGNGAGLTISSSSSDHSFLTGGVKWATQIGSLVPEVNVGYRYRFGDRFSTVREWFTPDPADSFNIISAAQNPGTFVAGISVGGNLGPVDVRISYEGEFSGETTIHSGHFSLTVPLGGHLAPAAPPPPSPPLPPPP